MKSVKMQVKEEHIEFLWFEVIMENITSDVYLFAYKNLITDKTRLIETFCYDFSENAS